MFSLFGVVGMVAVVAFWVTELPGGGFAMGEAADAAEARVMIAPGARPGVGDVQRALRPVPVDGRAGRGKDLARLGRDRG
jgi:hypothetical protein